MFGLGTHDGTVVTTPCSGAGTVTLHQEIVEAVNGELEFYSCQVQLQTLAEVVFT